MMSDSDGNEVYHLPSYPDDEVGWLHCKRCLKACLCRKNCSKAFEEGIAIPKSNVDLTAEDKKSSVFCFVFLRSCFKFMLHAFTCPVFSLSFASALYYFCSVFLGALKQHADVGDNSKQRKLLTDLGSAVATHPCNEKLILEACGAIKESFKEGALMEAIGVAAGIEAATKCVDVSGEDPPPAMMLSIMSIALNFINWIMSLFQRG